MFELLPIDIHKAPPYLALSYTWGSHTSDYAITVDGQSLVIPKNLADAIQSMGDYVKENHLMLWADSVCINQGDVRERNHQVGLMHSIYRCADCVGIWLGEPADESNHVMDKMTEWKHEFDRHSKPFGDSWELAVTSISASNTTFYGARGSTQYDTWVAFQMLIQRPWWGRAWIVQEATALGPSRTLLFCGNRMVNWATLRAALNISHHVVHVETQGMSLTFIQGMEAIRLDQFRHDRERGAYVRLFTVLELIRPFECQDPRDKLYASLGLAADVSEMDIAPDYTKSIEGVYADIARFTLSQSECYCLDFLGLVVQFREELGGTLSDLPTWVPDLRIRISMYAFERYLNVNDFTSPRAYNAGGNGAGLTTIDGHWLRVHGFVLDSIEKVYAACYHSLATGGLDIERQWRPENEMELYPLGGTIVEAFNHTLLADIGRPVMTSDALQRGMKVDWAVVDQDPACLTPEQKQRRSWMLIDIKRTTFGRRLIRTRAGLIGLGPGLAEVGDLICMLSGGHVLYVLRKKDRCSLYEFVGECYVHGMMDGEALNSLVTQREFVII